MQPHREQVWRYIGSVERNSHVGQVCCVRTSTDKLTITGCVLEGVNNAMGKNMKIAAMNNKTASHFT